MNFVKAVPQSDELESMRTLRGLALEIQDMEEEQKLTTLKWVVQKETHRQGNRFWLTVAKMLLSQPELIPRALSLTEIKLNSPQNIKCLRDSLFTFNDSCQVPLASQQPNNLAAFYQFLSKS
ncbi:MAG: hypothetical protein HZA78_10810 [Candidatus Schekmanbacteria bacterium]|nr:hypothetical protein [Candidatus Schekmanbacteria bacterium]